MNMATNGIAAFLQAEEDANRLVEELSRLKEEMESYKTAREAIDQVAKAASGLVGRLGEIAGQFAGVVETLRSIGTPELLRGQEAIAREVALLRQNLATTQQSVTEALAQAVGQVRTLGETLERAEKARQEEAQRVQQRMNARNLAFGSIGLSLLTLVLLGWVVLSLARG